MGISPPDSARQKHQASPGEGVWVNIWVEMSAGRVRGRAPTDRNPLSRPSADTFYKYPGRAA